MWPNRRNASDTGERGPSKMALETVESSPARIHDNDNPITATNTNTNTNTNLTSPSDMEKQPLFLESSSSSGNIDLDKAATTTNPATVGADSTTITSTGLKVLVLLAVQNCSKNLLMRFIMKDRPQFLTSAAVIGVETIKLILSTLYIVVVDKRPLSSIYTFLKEDHRNSILLAVPAAAYSLQMSLEYVALANLDAAVFSVLVQSKLLATATFAALVLRKKLKYIQVISLVLLTAGVMLCNVMTHFNKVKEQQTGGTGVQINLEEDSSSSSSLDAQQLTGVLATLGIATSSGFASVYTEKVIKAKRNHNVTRKNYSLAYMQVQLALVSLIIIGLYASIKDYEKIKQDGLWQNFTPGASFSMFNSAIGGLIVAAVLKYADAVLKGYATAISVVMTGVSSMLLFGTQLNVIYFLGVLNVIVAVLLYNGKNLDTYVC
eukprot:CAMPEP_0195285818 /NCGR_PEP_ID=MMETSP0707-20130614/3514_1 /TAXON_ID=33640 /ORGANISM="Asterionellopsis glacialis, Strain CCMP134" /LENGTH=433 /DNA_ID=CAMNT_0040345371 /DNA_START=85 /DNA_END=1386 /DNA_ORIENTATION=-